jgi:3-(3-hydroxy-phenyl)propionate hydroxylase
MADHAVVIAGGGPTGLMLAGELALAGVDVAIVERRSNQDLEGTRAKGLHARTIEMLDLRGIVDRFLAAGYTAQVAGYAWFPLDISDFPTRHPYGLALDQAHVERILAEWVRELGVPIYREHEVTGFSQNDTGVDVTVSGGRSMRAEYLVGCDGARSVVRKTAGIDFAGWDPTTSNLIAEVEVADEPEWGLRRDTSGIHSISKMDGASTVRVMVTEQRLGQREEPTLHDLSQALVDAYGRDFGVHNPSWISRFTDTTRQAEVYRSGRVLLAGDAAHVHYPTGGQGLNTGLQDAMNLGWKLALVVRGLSPDGLLDTYHTERHPVAATVLRNTMAQVALLRPDERTNALREAMADILQMEEPRKRIAGMISGLDIRYDLGEGHPLLGRRMPDLDLVLDGCEQRVYAQIHGARPALLLFDESIQVAMAGWADRVQRIDAHYDGPWEVPVIGEVAPPTGVLARPDGYVAWVGEGNTAGLEKALETWCGTPVAL